MEFIVQNSLDQKIYDITDIVYDVKLTETMNGGASKLTFSYLKVFGMLEPGSGVRFKYNNEEVFFGFIFETTHESEDSIHAIAYDQLRYLKGKESCILKKKKASDVLKEFAQKLGVVLGTVEDSYHIVPKRIVNNKMFLDVMMDYMGETLLHTNTKFVIRDEFGKVCFRNVRKCKTDVVLGDKYWAMKHSYKRSIDKETYTQIKITQPKGDTLKVYVLPDPTNAKKWGTLQYVEEVSENKPEAEIKKMAADLLKLYNRETLELSLPECIGNCKVRAGSGVRIVLTSLGIDKEYMVKQVDHTFVDSTKHTMSVTLLAYHN